MGFSLVPTRCRLIVGAGLKKEVGEASDQLLDFGFGRS